MDMLLESRWLDASFRYLPFIFNEGTTRPDNVRMWSVAKDVGMAMLHDELKEVCRSVIISCCVVFLVHNIDN